MAACAKAGLEEWGRWPWGGQEARNGEATKTSTRGGGRSQLTFLGRPLTCRRSVARFWALALSGTDEKEAREGKQGVRFHKWKLKATRLEDNGLKY